MSLHTYPDKVPSHIWPTLASAICSEPGILSSRNTPEALKGLYEMSLAVVIMDGGESSGFMAAWPVAEGFVEIGSVWIMLDHRGQRMSVPMYETIPVLDGVRRATVFGITKNPIALRAGRHARLELIDNWTSPIPWDLTCGPCDFVSEKNKFDCPARNTSCWLRVIK